MPLCVRDCGSGFEIACSAIFGWDVVILKYGMLLQDAFKEPGGDKLRTWIDTCPNQLYSALVFQGGAAWRKRLRDDLGDQGEVTQLIERRSDDELARLMTNLAGHDSPSLTQAFNAIDHDRPVCFICYTVKGFGLPMAGHKDNHAGLMTPAQMEAFRTLMNVRAGHEWDKFEGLNVSERALQDFSMTFRSPNGARAKIHPRLPFPARCPVTIQPVMATQTGFGTLLNEIGKRPGRICVSYCDDIAGRYGLDQSRPWVNRRGLSPVRHGRHVQERTHSIDIQLGNSRRKAQHIELGIAEMNLFIHAVCAWLVAQDQW